MRIVHNYNLRCHIEK